MDDLPAELVAASGHGSGTRLAPGESLHDQRLRFELQTIRRAIEEAGGDRKLAAQRLQISLSSLYAKLNGESVEVRGNSDEKARASSS